MDNIVNFISEYSTYFIIFGGGLYLIFTVLELVYGKKIKASQCDKCVHNEYCCSENKRKKFCDLYKPAKER